MNALLCLLLLAKAVYSDASNVDNSIQYDTSGFERSVRAFEGYATNMKMVGVTGATTKSFTVTITTSQEVTQGGTFSAVVRGTTEILNHDFKKTTNNKTEMQLIFSLEELDKFFKSLTFLRRTRTDADLMFKIEYLIKAKDDPTKNDYWAQYLVFPVFAKISLKETSSIIMVNPNEIFSRQLLTVHEEAIIVNNQILSVLNSSTIGFYYKLLIKDSTLVIEGKAPARLPQSFDGRYMSSLSFNLVDRISSQKSPTYTFIIELNPAMMKKLSDNNDVGLVYAALFVIFGISMIVFVVCYVKLNSNKQSASPPQQQPHEELPAENVLTKSIIDWTKNNTSTRDQTDKGNVLNHSNSSLNSSERFALKKNKKQTQPKYNQVNISTEEMQEAPQLQMKKTELAPRNQVEKPEPQTPDQHNMSQFEFSKIEDLDKTHAKNDFEFGEISKIAAGGLSILQADDNQANNPDLRLEDIILKDINN